MMNPHELIRRPIITEKATRMKDERGQVSFVVDIRANKLQIKKAVEQVFDVHVTSVRTLRMRGKRRRLGRYQGQRPDWKKAIVTLREGDRIEFFEGV